MSVSKVGKEVENQSKTLSTLKELMATRKELLRAIATVKSHLHKPIYLVGLIQFVAIVGAIISIVNFMLK